MADLAQAALHCAFEKHAGFLQSYTSDQLRRMMAVHRIMRTADGELNEVWKEHAGKVDYFEAHARPLIFSALQRLLQLAPEYVSEEQRGVPPHMMAACMVLKAFRREVACRMTLTQWDRAKRAERLVQEFETTDQSTTKRLELNDQIRYLLQDINCIANDPYQAMDDGIIWLAVHRQTIRICVSRGRVETVAMEESDAPMDEDSDEDYDSDYSSDS